MTEQTKTKNWKKMNTFDTFAEADDFRNNLKETFGDDIEVRVRRCGIGGTKFMVKTWSAD